MSEDLCYIHGYEPLPDKYYRMCGECFHCFVTEQELVQKDLDVRREAFGPDAEVMQAEDIHTCPECTHDF